MQGSESRYEGPVVKDYGDLVALTAAIHTPLGVGTAPDLSFSNGVHGQVASGGGGTVNAPVAGGTVSPTAQGLHATPVGGVSGATHGPSGAGAGAGGTGSPGGGGGAGGGTLPFTGFSLAVPAALGAAMTAAGSLLRRVLRRTAG